jgi:hypothetical protein
MKNETKTVICKHIGISEDDYNALVFNTAYDYLSKTIPNDKFGVDLLTGSKTFWTWWTNQWERRERLFIREIDLDKVNYIIAPSEVQLIKDLWHETHEVEGINIYPSRVVFENAYAEMIGDVFDERRSNAR